MKNATIYVHPTDLKFKFNKMIKKEMLRKPQCTNSLIHKLVSSESPGFYTSDKASNENMQFQLLRWLYALVQYLCCHCPAADLFT